MDGAGRNVIGYEGDPVLSEVTAEVPGGFPRESKMVLDALLKQVPA